MNDSEKIKMLKEILKDKDTMSKGILGESEPVEGKLIVEAEGSSPEEAKGKIMEGLDQIELPDEEDMGMCECGDTECEGECKMDESSMGEEDKGMMEMLPEKSKMQFKKRIMEKLKGL